MYYKEKRNDDFIQQIFVYEAVLKIWATSSMITDPKVLLT